MTDYCNTQWVDELNPDSDARNVRCRRQDGHTGPHYNPTAGVTWGAPNNWFGDAA